MLESPGFGLLLPMSMYMVFFPLNFCPWTWFSMQNFKISSFLESPWNYLELWNSFGNVLSFFANFDLPSLTFKRRLIKEYWCCLTLANDLPKGFILNLVRFVRFGRNGRDSHAIDWRILINANADQCKCWSMQMLINADADQCKCWSMQMLSNANAEQCKCWAMQMLSNANAKQCKC